MILTHKVQDPEKSSCAKWQQQQNDNQNSFPDLVFVVWLVAHCLGIHMKGFYLINFLKNQHGIKLLSLHLLQNMHDYLQNSMQSFRRNEYKVSEYRQEWQKSQPDY